MTPPRSRRSARFRFLLAVVVVGGITALGWSARSLGHLLHHEDPLEPADAVLVLGGSWLERIAEAGHLYADGITRTIVVSQGPSDAAVDALRARGLKIANASDFQIDALTKMGVPLEAIHVLDPQNATASEATAISQLAQQRGWRTLIVVTHKLHTARAGLVMKRRTAGMNVRILMRSTRYDPADIDHWWRDRDDLRFVLLETQKMLVYWLGVAD